MALETEKKIEKSKSHITGNQTGGTTMVREFKGQISEKQKEV
jgi:hypothetical protein